MRRLKIYKPERNEFIRNLTFGGLFTLGLWASKIIALTLIGFMLLQNHKHTDSEPITTTLQRVSDSTQANLMAIYGCAALLFLLMLRGSRPISRTKISTIISKDALYAKALPGLLTGTLIVFAFTLGNFIGNTADYLGIYSRLDELVFNSATQVLACGLVFIYFLVDEYFFRILLDRFLRRYFNNSITLITSTLLYTAQKMFLFGETFSIELCFTFIAFNILLSTIAKTEHSHLTSTLTIFTITVLLHYILGFPYFSQELPTIFIMRGKSDLPSHAMLSGGVSGPFFGLSLPLLVIFVATTIHFRNVKRLRP